MNESTGKEYIYSNSVQVYPEKIQTNDKIFIDHLFSYLNPRNILKINGEYHQFKPVINARVEVSQLDQFHLKVNVLLKNDKIDWYIPRFEEKSVYSEKKIYLIGEDNRIIKTFPEWWSIKIHNKNGPLVHIIRPEHIGLFARFNKGDQYKLEYIIDIPDINEEQLKFDLFYQDYTMPYDELSNKYSGLYDDASPRLIIKSNIVKVKCKRLSRSEAQGYICEINN